MPFIPHTEDDIREMLAALGTASIGVLFDEIPASLRCRPLDLPPALKEMEVARLMHARAGQNRPLLCFAGAGAYEHHVPAAVWAVAGRGEFYSAYTPYQAEASQGTLHVLYEYQSMMASLTALDVSNASLYDGATSLAEAVLMAVRTNRKSHSRRILMPKTVHPFYRRVVETIVGSQALELIELPYDLETGRIDPAALETHSGTDVAALVIPQINFFGVLEAVDELTDWAAANGAIAIALVNPMALAVLKPPGEWGREGADIACGDGQPLGIPLSGGGPYFGFMCCRKAHLHQLPGRLVGRTVDVDGKPGFTLTLQAREQHIRRGRATSNICTNQGLMVTAATIYMALLGPEGLRRVALQSHRNTVSLMQGLAGIEGVDRVFAGPFFHEAVIRTRRPAREIMDGLAERGILGGYELTREYPELGEAILVCVTETRTREDIESYLCEIASLLGHD
ncbi:glycine cleavage system protein P (pyridoxal-binding), N-terminal domain protein [Methylocaldum marinum]|uniref:Probable glycine dehydrogenase (decarboxylating) subunit 1 n=1 Tax=Methylocaldum marinum TaxID=1432792 RepID=A0A250KWZ7_9GAMM|nr:aminomethyl-transferring glycine dehydrogenase subunit GcvPA [Methylocaldum marinum]BBA35481.1 glycine cleavage system protein P (pyridoxal-binding), N-terminal domain protein [Methylocaldum marinum]